MVLVLLVSGFFLFVVWSGSQIVSLYCFTSIISWLQFWWYLLFGFVFLVTLYILFYFLSSLACNYMLVVCQACLSMMVVFSLFCLRLQFMCCLLLFLILDMCGSFLAFAAAPMTKVNFASSSWAIIWRACSLVCISIFVFVCGSACFFS